MLKISVEKIPSLIKALSEKYPLFLPVERGGEVNFTFFKDGDRVRLDKLRTVKSPKECFFPHSEDVVHFNVDGKNIEIEPVSTKQEQFIVMGMRACDFKAVDILDEVFLSEPQDTSYMQRRQNALIITQTCLSFDERCFCDLFGIDRFKEVGDVSFSAVNDYYYFKPLTDEGRALIDLYAHFFEKCDEKEALIALEGAKEKSSSAFGELPLRALSLEELKKGKMLDIFNDGSWSRLSETCLSCGACTYVCPTCQCFDIREHAVAGRVTRFRCWDSCMYSDFTKMAGGQPRTQKMQRFRQRFMHKLVYYPMQNKGVFACVGCGRCLAACPQSVSIVKVIKTLGGKKDDSK